MHRSRNRRAQALRVRVPFTDADIERANRAVELERAVRAGLLSALLVATIGGTGVWLVLPQLQAIAGIP